MYCAQYLNNDSERQTQKTRYYFLSSIFGRKRGTTFCPGWPSRTKFLRMLAQLRTKRPSVGICLQCFLGKGVKGILNSEYAFDRKRWLLPSPAIHGLHVTAQRQEKTSLKIQATDFIVVRGQSFASHVSTIHVSYRL